MARIAFCGLGRMGAPMAGRLLDAGHTLTVWNRSVEKARPLAERGATVAPNPREAAAGAEFAITMLADEPALDAVLFGEDGLAAGLAAGAMLVEMSTIGPLAIRRIRERLSPAIPLVDAPVFGSVPQAESGRLSIFAGGDAGDVERARSVLDAMGSPRRVGELGAGAALKLVVNSTLGSVMVAVGEALALARALGVDEQIALEALRGTYVGGVIESKGEAMATGYRHARFTLALAAKDLRLVTDTAAGAGLELEAARANRAVYERADEAGMAELDYAAVIEFLRSRAAH